MLKSISLKNFQKHAELSAEFQPGLNLIVGQNWSGKSTIQRAILFALFGSSAVPVKVDQLIRSGERAASVTLVFDHYQVDRSTKDAVLTDLGTGQVLASGQTSVTIKIEELLGVTAKNFLAFHVARQKEAGSLLSLGSAKLAAHINAVTGVDLVDKVLLKLRDETNRLAGPVSDLDAAEAALAQAETEAARLRGLLSVKAPELESTRASYAALYQASREAWGRLETAQEQAQQCAHSKAQRAVFADQEQQCRDALAQLIEPIQTQEAEVEAARAGLQRSLQVRQQHQRWEADFYEAHESLGRAKDRLVELASVSLEPVDIAPDEAELATLGQQIGALKERLVGLQLSMQSAVCHACHRPMGGVDQAQIERDLQATGEEWGEKETELRAVKERLETSRLHNRTWESHQREMQAFQQLVTTAQERFDALSGQSWAVETDERIQGRQEEVGYLTRNRSIYVHWQTAHGHLITTLQRLKDKVSLLPPDEGPSEADVLALKDVYLASQRDVEALQGYLTQLDQEVNALTQELRTLEDKIVGSRGLVDGGRAAKARLARVTKLTKYLRDNRDRFSSEIWQQILSFAGQFISSATTGKVTSLLRTADGDFKYVEDGEERDIELASGLQEDILGVGLKLALGAALGGPVDFMLFDEVSAAGEDENALLLTSLLKEAGQQVVLISHRVADCAVADWVISV